MERLFENVGASGHKYQSFLKNGGQQKCLDKALVIEL